MYPPHTPTIRNVRADGLTMKRLSEAEIAATKPMTNDPLILITSVLNGNQLPYRSANTPDNQKRLTPPTALPNATTR